MMQVQMPRNAENDADSKSGATFMLELSAVLTQAETANCV